jgi:hypothetical protein
VRIDPDKLVDLARSEAEQRAKVDDVISAYLIGSVARGDPLLGDTADIDLVLIHSEPPAQVREMVFLSEQVHLDIAHHARDLYASPKDLRIHPWLGPAMCEPVFLHDPQHFFEWAQAGARGQFFRPDHTLARAHAFLKRARQAKAVLPLSSRWLNTYMRAVMDGANAVVSLTDFPAAGRRFALSLQRATVDLAQPEIYHGFLRLLGADALNGSDLPEWVGAFAYAYDDASATLPNPELAPYRQPYFVRGFQALMEAGQPEAIVATLFKTWEGVLHTLESADQDSTHLPVWLHALKQSRLGPLSVEIRMEELERYLDAVETILETWAEQHGA